MKSAFTAMLSIGMVLLLAGAGTFAYFNDTETTSGNTLTAGTLDLKISDDNEGPGDGVSATYIMSDMEPGVTTVTNTLSVYNSGNIDGNHVEISFSHELDENWVESDIDPDSDPGDLAEWIQITSWTYDGTNFVTSYTDANGNGWFDLEDVTMSPYIDVGGPLDDLMPPLKNNVGSQSFSMTLYFRPGATDDIQGDILTTTITFTLNQDDDQ